MWPLGFYLKISLFASIAKFSSCLQNDAKECFEKALERCREEAVDDENYNRTAISIRYIH